MIIDHNHPRYRQRWNASRGDRYNGAFYYSKEIVDIIIPRVKTDRNWITIDMRCERIGCDHAIVFVHNHPHCPEWYEWLRDYRDLIMVVSSEDEMEKVEHIGTPVYLPLSVDVEYVKQFREARKTKQIAFAGRPEKMMRHDLSGTIDFLFYLPRPLFLAELAKYKQVYAVDRASIEAKVLGCEVLDYGHDNYDPGVIIDSRDAAKMLQKELDRIDGVS